MENNTEGTKAPPTTLRGILSHLGPGLIIAGSIVGSGELIATTKTGAEAGFSLLWLILIGCVIKVFAQIEFGRFAIVNGMTTLDGLNQVPGPRIRFRRANINWLIGFWFIMAVVAMGQGGGILGGVGQALAISAPLTDDGRAYTKAAADLVKAKVSLAQAQTGVEGAEEADLDALAERVAELESEAKRLAPLSHDDQYWAAIMAIITSVVLINGRYGLIQTFSTVMVATFTLVTVGNVISLQSIPAWAVSPEEILEGLRFRLSVGETEGGNAPLATALMTFGIIGVGAGELIAYPYWCIEKGYARFSGKRDDSEAWAARARGWLNVMRWDAVCSMFVYTFATIAFYLLGAAILWRVNLNPSGTDMIVTLGAMYAPVFGEWAQLLFLFGAFAVLYSTFFVATAGGARVYTDAAIVLGFMKGGEERRRKSIRILSGVLPFIPLIVYLFVRAPVKLVMMSGAMQAMMLSFLGLVSLYFRYRRCDKRVMPGKTWDVFLWISAFGLVLAGGYLFTQKVLPMIGNLF